MTYQSRSPYVEGYKKGWTAGVQFLAHLFAYPYPMSRCGKVRLGLESEWPTAWLERDLAAARAKQAKEADHD